jgi:hypothetical protein
MIGLAMTAAGSRRAIGLAVAAALASCAPGSADRSIKIGKITGFRPVESESQGSVLYAFVDLPDGRNVLLAMPEKSSCGVGASVTVASDGYRSRIISAVCK